MVNIIFLGAPGSGKGTQSTIVSKELNIPSISTGEILRKEVSAESKVGVLAKSYMESGKLVPDEVVVEIIKNRITINDCDNGFILDGFPRNLSQAEILDKMLSDSGKLIDLVINIEIPDETIIKRISGRFSCKECGSLYNHFFSPTKLNGVCDNCGKREFESRSDDGEETVRNRLKIYNTNANELVNFYRKKDLIYSIDGLDSVASLSSSIKSKIKSVKKNPN